MRKTTTFILWAVIIMTVSGCQRDKKEDTTQVDSNRITVTFNTSESSPFNNGIFQGWGTSLCWWANRLGYDETLTQKAAVLFFSEEGLGLDIGRYNVGGGDDPEHNHITRSDSKVPGYATGFDGNGNIVYDWNVDQNQRNIVLAALRVNPNLYVEGFSNSPPWFMTNSGCSSGGIRASDDNLNPEHLEDFAKYIADVTLYFKDNFGIRFQSYSPMNEPDTTYWSAFSNKQEGSRFSSGESQSNMIIATRNALDAAGLGDVLVAGMDESVIDQTYRNLDRLTAPALAALGRIDAHTYGGSMRQQLKEKAVSLGKNLWMSEFDSGDIAGGATAGDMRAGLYLASRIMLDMNGMQPSAWVLWNIVDFHKDSTFVAPNGSYTEANTSLNQSGGFWGVSMGDHDNKEIILSQKYYVFGQFTRYINPGDTIISSSDEANILAAWNRETGAVKIVVLNQTVYAKPLYFDLSVFNNNLRRVSVIRTMGAYDGGEQWAEISELELSGKGFSFELPGYSVTTFVVE
jgi:O-glycosyl hydrolase